MGLVGSTTEFPRATSAQVVVFALLGVLVDNESALTGLARIFALEARISGQLVLSPNTKAVPLAKGSDTFSLFGTGP